MFGRRDVAAAAAADQAWMDGVAYASEWREGERLMIVLAVLVSATTTVLYWMQAKLSLMTVWCWVALMTTLAS